MNIKIRFKRFAHANGERISVNAINALTMLARNGGFVEYEARALCWTVRNAHGNAITHFSVAELKSLAKSGLVALSGYRAVPTDKVYFLAGAKCENVLLADNHRVRKKQNNKSHEQDNKKKMIE